MHDVRRAVGPAEESDCEVAARKVRCLPAPTSPRKEDQGAVRGYAGRLGAEGHLLGRVPALPWHQVRNRQISKSAEEPWLRTPSGSPSATTERPFLGAVTRSGDTARPYRPWADVRRDKAQTPVRLRGRGV